MKIKEYTVDNNNFHCFWVDSTFEVNLLTNNNKVNPLGAIVCGRVISAFTIIDSLLRKQNLINENSTLELNIVGTHGCSNLQVLINEFGEMYFNSDALVSFYTGSNGNTEMDVSQFMCGENFDDLMIRLVEHQQHTKINLCDKYDNCEFWVSNSGNISDEFTLILNKFSFTKTALSVGVEYDFAKFKTQTSGALLYIAKTNDEKVLLDFSKHIKNLEQIKDLFKNQDYDEDKITKKIVGNYSFLFNKNYYYTFNFASFLKPSYDKTNVINAFKKLNMNPNYAQIVNANYSSNFDLLVKSCQNSPSKIYSHKDINFGVIGIYETNDYIKSALLNLNIEFSDELVINNDYDEEFYQSCINVLNLFNNEFAMNIGFDNHNIKLSGSSLSCSMFYKLYCLKYKLQPNTYWIFSGNLDKYGNVKYVSSLIFKVKAAISNSYPVFITSIENKKELEHKLLAIEKSKIKIVYIENIVSFLDSLRSKIK